MGHETKEISEELRRRVVAAPQASNGPVRLDSLSEELCIFYRDIQYNMNIFWTSHLC